jgi:hypothetical protein
VKVNRLEKMRDLDEDAGLDEFTGLNKPYRRPESQALFAGNGSIVAGSCVAASIPASYITHTNRRDKAGG